MDISGFLEAGDGQGPGRPTDALHMEVVGEVTAADMLALTDPSAKEDPTPLQKIRSIHHRIAYLLAAEVPLGQVAAVVGMSVSRISSLKNNPAFAELLQLYIMKQDEVLQKALDLLQDISMDALAELRDRLTDTPDNISTGDLIAISKLVLDRTGHGPTTKQESISVHMSTEELRRLNEGVQRNAAKDVKIVQGTRIA